MLEIVNCPKCKTRMRSYMVDTAGAHYRCDFCGFLYPENVHVTYGTSTTQSKFGGPTMASNIYKFSIETTIKPCPFCGGKGELVIDYGPTPFKYIMCKSCHAQSGQFPYIIKDSDVVENWNRRGYDPE